MGQKCLPFLVHETKYFNALYEKITEGKIKYPKHFSHKLRDVLYQLLQVDLTRRLGNLKGGADDIKNHVWFDLQEFGGDWWLMIFNKKLPAPFIPTIKSITDTSNFDAVEEEELKICQSELFSKQFKDF